MEDHLASYHRVDISLDTFPYNGTTTTCEALWMGVPVVNLTGDRHASRVGASLLHAAGHPEWVTSCWEGYEDACRALATDPARLSYLRPRLRQQLQASALCDHPGQAADFGALILQMLGLSK